MAGDNARTKSRLPDLVTTRTPQHARPQSRRHRRVAGAVCANALTRSIRTRCSRVFAGASCCGFTCTTSGARTRSPRQLEELSNLADAILEYALRLSRQRLDNRFGSPQRIDSEGRVVATEFCVVALGKLGSRELNYASDIDLMFLFSDEGMTAVGGARGQVTNREYPGAPRPNGRRAGTTHDRRPDRRSRRSHR